MIPSVDQESLLQNQLAGRSNSRSYSTERSVRNSRNSISANGDLTIGPRADELPEANEEKDNKTLMIIFCSMVCIGLGNKVFNKLMTIPMYNYPNFLNLLTTFVYIPVCFSYIIPMVKYGKISQENLDVPKKKFAIMGGLDSLAGTMQIFSTVYLPGPLIILLTQAAIPVTMIISKYLLGATYTKWQYIGALIVAAGIVIVLAPTLSGGGSVLWSIVLMLSTVPMALSSVYKEIALGDTDLDPVYLNGWVAVYQFIISCIVAIPAALVSEPPVAIPDLPENMWNGLKCYFGVSTMTCDDDDDCEADDCYLQAPLFVNIYIVFNQFYNLVIILILKYGSANLLYLALTVMVPLGNVAFTLPFVPEHSSLKVTDIIGLIVICGGLGFYRFGSDLIAKYFGNKNDLGDGYTEGDKAGDEKANLFSSLLNDDETENPIH